MYNLGLKRHFNYHDQLDLNLDTSLYFYENPISIKAFNQVLRVTDRYNNDHLVNLNDIFSLPLEVPINDEAPPPTSFGYPYNPYINGLEENIVVNPLYYLYDHLDERMIKKGLIKGRKSTFEMSEPKHQFRLRLYRMLINFDCSEYRTIVHYAADYFPFGKTIWEYKLQELDGEPLIEDTVEPRFKSTQHERDQLSGFDFRGARYYDSEFGVFLSVDPLASDFTAWSPYNYVMGNPIRLVDPDGRAPEDIIFRFKNSLNEYSPGVIIKSKILNYTFDIDATLPGISHDVVTNNPTNEPLVIEGLDDIISSSGKNSSQNLDAISFNIGVKGTRGLGFGTETNFTLMTGGSDNGKLGVYQQANTRIGYEKIGSDFSVTLLGDGKPNANSLNLSSFAGYETGFGGSLPFLSVGHVQGYDKNPLTNPFSASLIYSGVTFGTGNFDGVLKYDHPEISAHLGKSVFLGSIDSNENE